MSNLSFTYPTPEGWVEEVITKQEAVDRQVEVAILKSNHLYKEWEDALFDFLSSNCAMLTDKPVGKYYESFIKSNN